jgi:hypothetical protein
MRYEVIALAADPDLAMAVFTADPGSKSEEALNLLASWTGEIEPAHRTEA